LTGTWTLATVYTSGSYIYPTRYNGFLYECTTGGQSGVTEPTWDEDPTTPGTTNDNTAVWTTRQFGKSGNAKISKGSTSVTLALALILKRTIGKPAQDIFETNRIDPRHADYRSGSEVWQMELYFMGDYAYADAKILGDLMQTILKYDVFTLTLSQMWETMYGASHSVTLDGSAGCIIEPIPGSIDLVKVSLQYRTVYKT